MTPPTTRLVAVYRSRQEADAVADAVRELGVADDEVLVGHRDDQSAAAVAEQREEMGATEKLGPSAVITKEQVDGATTAMPFGTIAGAVLGLGLGLLLPSSMALGLRLLLGAGIGALFGAVATMVIGAGLGARGPAVPGAAQGTPVSVAGNRPDVRRVLEDADYVRIDLVEGVATSTVATEEDGADHGVPRLKAKLQQPTEGDWSSIAPEQPRADDDPHGGTRQS